MARKKRSQPQSPSTGPVGKKAKTSARATPPQPIQIADDLVAKSEKALAFSLNLEEEDDNEFMDDLRAMERELGITDEASLKKFQEELLREDGQDMLNLLHLTDDIMKGVNAEGDEEAAIFSDDDFVYSQEEEEEQTPANRTARGPHATTVSSDDEALSASDDVTDEAIARALAPPKPKKKAMIEADRNDQLIEEGHANKAPGQSESKKPQSAPCPSSKAIPTREVFDLIETFLSDLKRLEGAEGYKTKIKSSLNKLSEGNMDIILKEVISLPQGVFDTIKTALNVAVSRGRIKEKEKDAVNTTSCALWVGHQLACFAHALGIANQMTTPSLISTMTSFCGGCYRSNRDMAVVVAKFAQMCQESLVNGMKILQEGSDHKKFEETRFECRSAVQSLSLAFDFGLIDHSTLFSLLKFLCGPVTEEGLEECRADLILILLKFSDGGIKKILDKAVVTEVFDYIGARMPKEIGQVTNRKNFLLEEISKMRDPNYAPPMGNERFDFVRNWVQRQGPANTPNLSLGWLPGEDFETLLQRAGGFIGGSSAGGDIQISRKKEAAYQAAASSDKQEKLLLAAQTLKLHSQIQQTAFIALMGAVDEEDAIERILTSVEAKKDIPVVVAVIILVATKTNKFNPFYLNVLRDLCFGGTSSAVKNAYKFAVKKCVAAQLGAIHTASKSERQLLGTVIGHLVFRDVISSSQLRFINIKSAKDTLRTFALALAELLAKSPERTAESLFAQRGEEHKTIHEIEDIRLLLSNALDQVISKLDGKKDILKRAVEIKNCIMQ